jgi:TfoX/Sxy family transcriptional regulator of competence genes
LTSLCDTRVNALLQGKTVPFDEILAARVRKLMVRRKLMTEKKMFGGIGFLLGGNMCCGVWKQYLILRVGPDHYEDALQQPHVKEFDITGRAMKGWVMVEPGGVETDNDLQDWVRRATKFAGSLPAKD